MMGSVILGQYDKAIGLLEQASSIAQEEGNRQGQSHSCLSLASCHQEMGQYETAITFHEQALRVTSEELGNSNIQGYSRSLQGLGECFTSLGNYAQAMQYRTKQWALSQQQVDASSQAPAELNSSSLRLTEQQVHAALGCSDAVDARAPSTVRLSVYR
jgi:tetratricopeptide (TPR) repeat protein